MAHASDHRALLLQNLKDAGCDNETIQSCLSQFMRNDSAGMLRILSQHRHNLLDTAYPFPEGTRRGEAYNPHLKELETLIQELRSIGAAHQASPAQVAAAWAIAKGSLPIIGVTKVRQVEEAAAAIQIVLSDEEVSRLEKLGDEAGVNTLREWEKEMA